MPAFSLIIPSLDRPDYLAALLASIYRTSTLANETIIGQGRVDNLSAYVNALAERATGDYLFVLNDDSEMVTKNWDSIALQTLHPFAYGATTPRGSLDWADDGLGASSFPLVGREAYRTLGWLLPPHLTGWGADDFLFSVYAGAHLVVPVAVELVHHKPRDATQARQAARDNRSHHPLAPDAYTRTLQQARSGGQPTEGAILA